MMKTVNKFHTNKQIQDKNHEVDASVLVVLQWLPGKRQYGAPLGSPETALTL